MPEILPQASHEPEQIQNHLSPSKDQIRDLGTVVLFRVMNLEGHSGVTSSDERGTNYVTDNQQYPTQGDFAFSGPDAFDAAVTRAYPNYTGNIHLLEVAKQHVVEPHPEDMPGVVYVKNGTEVVARKVPQNIVDQHIDRINSKTTPFTSRDVIQKMSTTD